MRLPCHHNTVPTASVHGTAPWHSPQLAPRQTEEGKKQTAPCGTYFTFKGEADCHIHSWLKQNKGANKRYFTVTHLPP